MIDLAQVFEDNDSEFLKFERIVNKKHSRPDICAFLILAELLPSEDDIVIGAEHDIIFLDADFEQLAEVASEQDIIDLLRCGVMLSSEYDCLAMYV